MSASACPFRCGVEHVVHGAVGLGQAEQGGVAEKHLDAAFRSAMTERAGGIEDGVADFPCQATRASQGMAVNEDSGADPDPPE